MHFAAKFSLLSQRNLFSSLPRKRSILTTRKILCRSNAGNNCTSSSGLIAILSIFLPARSKCLLSEDALRLFFPRSAKMKFHFVRDCDKKRRVYDVSVHLSGKWGLTSCLFVDSAAAVTIKNGGPIKILKLPCRVRGFHEPYHVSIINHCTSLCIRKNALTYSHMQAR